MINIREYQKEDAYKIYDFFTKHTKYKRDSQFWIWINRLLSDERSIICIAEINNAIIGHYAIVPRKLCIENKLINAGLGVHALVDPYYRNTLSIFSITEKVYQLAKERGIDIVYGFPNDNYRLIQEKIERWTRISLFNAFEKKITYNKSYKTFYNWISIEELQSDDLIKLDDLLNVSKKYIYLNKPLRYIINRYFLHPQKLYKKWFIESEGKKIGLVITKLFDDLETKKCHIIDIIGIENLNLEFMLIDFENLHSLYADFSVQWPINKEFKRTLLKFDYSQEGFKTFFGAKIISDNFCNSNIDYKDIENWELYMGDSDAF